MSRYELFHHLGNVLQRSGKSLQQSASKLDARTSPEFNAVILNSLGDDSMDYLIQQNLPMSLIGPLSGGHDSSEILPSDSSYFLATVNGPVSFMQADTDTTSYAANRVIEQGSFRLSEVKSFPDEQVLSDSNEPYSVNDFTFTSVNGIELPLPLAMQLRDGSQFFAQYKENGRFVPDTLNEMGIKRQMQLREVSQGVFQYNTVDALRANVFRAHLHKK